MAECIVSGMGAGGGDGWKLIDTYTLIMTNSASFSTYGAKTVNDFAAYTKVRAKVTGTITTSMSGNTWAFDVEVLGGAVVGKQGSLGTNDTEVNFSVEKFILPVCDNMSSPTITRLTVSPNNFNFRNSVSITQPNGMRIESANLTVKMYAK